MVFFARCLWIMLLVAALPSGAQAPESAPTATPPTFGEAIDVRLAEIYVSVVDKKGQAVPGLTLADFTVEENQLAQELSSATTSAELPITLGLAIDSSASMFVKLPAVVKAARALLSSLFAGKDRAFLVGFGGTPELVQPTTNNLDRVSNALSELEPKGTTPLWTSISVALGELERSRGKRALIVFLDGADEDARSEHQFALERAQAMGVPVYLIVMNNEAARSGGRDFQTRAFISRLERMAAAGGGRVIFVPTHADLTSIYRTIAEELRSAYLLTYYPSVPLAAGGQRRVEVKVAKKGVKVRALTGYTPTTAASPPLTPTPR